MHSVRKLRTRNAYFFLAELCVALTVPAVKPKRVCMELPRLKLAAKRRGVARLSMTPEQYRLARQLRGTQSEVANFLRVSKATIHRRESGKIAITHEATLALMAMPPAKTETSEAPGQQQTEFARAGL
jgi:DNA-binding XRE family transcriptional regulator